MAGQDNYKQAPDFHDVEHGPLDTNKRQCRDILCFILFVANIVVLIIFAIWSYSNGSPYNAFRATDNALNVCGKIGSSAENYKYAYFYNPLSMGNRVCVKACPALVNGSVQSLNCLPGGTTCPSSYTIEVDSNGQLDQNRTISSSDFVGYDSYSILGRVCLPTLTVLNKAFKDYSTTFSSSLSSSNLSNFITDIQNNWYYLLAGAGFAVVIAFILMFLMRWIAPLMIWLSIFGTIAVFIGAGFIFLYNSGALSSYNNTLGNLGIPTLSASSHYNIYGGICFGIALVLIILLLCCCSRIRLAIAVCNVAGQFVVRVAQVMIVPIIMGAIIIGFWAFAIASFAYIIGTATFVANGDIFTSINDYTQRSLGMFYYFFFGTLWTSAFLDALTIFVIASACCMWYFSRGPGDQLNSPITTGFYRAFRFHFGSLAFGSLILAIIQFIQWVVQIVKQRTVDQTDNACAKCAVRCLQCFLKCVERIVQYLNKTAYIQIALRGKNFCMAAFDGFSAIASNPLRYGAVAGVGTILMFITQLLIASGATGIFYILITYNTTIKNNIMQPILLLILVFLFSYAIAIVFMSVYSVAMDTILACFIADQANQKDKTGKPLYAPQQLTALMDK